MAPHSSTVAWKIPWTEESGRLQSMGSLRVGHDFTFTFMHWRKEWQPAPEFLPGESQGWGEPGGLPSMGLHRVGHDRSDLAAAALKKKSICINQYDWLLLLGTLPSCTHSHLLGFFLPPSPCILKGRTSVFLTYSLFWAVSPNNDQNIFS